jgi:purine-nucleoside phosphorylase
LKINLNAKYRNTLEALIKQIPFEPDICIILGSGLGDFASKVQTEKSIKTSELPDYPKSTIQGHPGYLHFSKYKNKKLLIVQGRIHFYEGYSLSQCVLPVFIASKLKCKYILLTNAAGSVTRNFKPGDFMLASSFNSINIKKEISEVIGLTSLDQKIEFLDFPSVYLNQTILQAALEEKISLKEGVYWYSKGPNYETPAEISMVRKFGGDAVGMSTVHEAVFASCTGLKVGSISCITNYAAGLSPQKLSHEEVMASADKAKSKFERLIKKTIELITLQ